MGINIPQAQVIQRRLGEWIEQKDCRNIQAYGDPLLKREDNDGILWFVDQKIRTSEMNYGFQVIPEIKVMREVGADVQGMSEINKPWTAGNKAIYQTQSDTVFRQALPTFSGVEPEFDTKRQQGGTYSS